MFKFTMKKKGFSKVYIDYAKKTINFRVLGKKKAKTPWSFRLFEGVLYNGVITPLSKRA